MRVELSTINNKTTTRTETLGKYFNDIPNYNPEVIDNINEIYRLYKKETDPRKKERYKNQIISANLLFVVSIAKRYSNAETLLDVIQEGNIGLLKALDSYNPDKNVRFITYAVNYIVREINKYKTRDEHLVRGKNSNKIYYTKAKAREAFFKKYHREPSIEEIQQYINDNTSNGYHIKNKHDLIGVHMTYVDDVSTTQNDKLVHAGEITEFNSYTASQNDYEHQSELDYISTLTGSLLKGLTPREQTVIKYAFGINQFKEFNNEEIGEKIGFTPERVRQIKQEALKKLRKAYLKKYKIH